MSSVVMMAVFLVSSKCILTFSGWKENSACVCHDDFDSVKCIKTSVIHHIVLKCLCRCKKLSLVHFCRNIHFWETVFLANNLEVFSDNELCKLISPSICSYFLVSLIDEIEHSCKVPSQSVCFFHETLCKIHILFSLLFYQHIAIKKKQFNNSSGNI